MDDKPQKLLKQQYFLFEPVEHLHEEIYGLFCDDLGRDETYSESYKLIYPRIRSRKKNYPKISAAKFWRTDAQVGYPRVRVSDSEQCY